MLGDYPLAMSMEIIKTASVEEAGVALGLRPPAVIKLIRSRKLAAAKISGHWRIGILSINALLADAEGTGTTGNSSSDFGEAPAPQAPPPEPPPPQPAQITRPPPSPIPFARTLQSVHFPSDHDRNPPRWDSAHAQYMPTKIPGLPENPYLDEDPCARFDSPPLPLRSGPPIPPPPPPPPFYPPPPPPPGWLPPPPPPPPGWSATSSAAVV